MKASRTTRRPLGCLQLKLATPSWAEILQALMKPQAAYVPELQNS